MVSANRFRRKRPQLTHQDSLEYVEVHSDLKESRWKGIHFVNIIRNLDGSFTYAEHYKRFIRHFDKSYILFKWSDTHTVAEWQYRQSKAALYRQFGYTTAMLHLTVNLMRLSAISSSAASVRRWLNQGCQVWCSLAEHYASSAALHTGTVLYLKQLPAWSHRNLTTRPKHRL